MESKRAGQQSVFVLEGTRSDVVVRELSKRGLHVSFGDITRPPINLVSRYIDDFVLLPNYQEIDEYVKILYTQIAELESNTLIPCSTVTIGIVSSFSKYLKSIADFLVPEPEAMSIAFDKLQCIKAAEKVGVPVPRTKEFVDPNDAENFPQVVKPRFETGAARGFALIRDELDAEKVFSEKMFGPLLLQEYIPGSSRQMRCCDLLFDRLSRPKAVFTMRKYLESPATGGTTIWGVSSIDPEIAELATRLLSKISWRGVAEVEFKVDPRDGQPKLMEINPRFWAYLELPIRCGVNFPLLLYKLCLGMDFDPVLSYLEGVGYIRLVGNPNNLFRGLLSVPHTRGLIIDWLDLEDPRLSMAKILQSLRKIVTRNPVTDDEARPGISLQEILRKQLQRNKIGISVPKQKKTNPLAKG